MSYSFLLPFFSSRHVTKTLLIGSQFLLNSGIIFHNFYQYVTQSLGFYFIQGLYFCFYILTSPWNKFRLIVLFSYCLLTDETCSTIPYIPCGVSRVRIFFNSKHANTKIKLNNYILSLGGQSWDTIILRGGQSDPTSLFLVMCLLSKKKISSFNSLSPSDQNPVFIFNFFSLVIIRNTIFFFYLVLNNY